MIVLGVDPGTATTGYGVVRRADPGVPPRHRLIECGVITTRPGESLAERLRVIFEEMSALLERHRPSTLAIEGLFIARNARSALVLGQARGVVLLAAARSGVEVAEYPPAVVKKTVVGAGAATKHQVQRMLAHLLGLASPPQPDDAADGVAVALTHCMRTGRVFRRAAIR